MKTDLIRRDIVVHATYSQRSKFSTDSGSYYFHTIRSEATCWKMRWKNMKRRKMKKRIYQRKVKYPESFLYSFSLWIQLDFYLSDAFWIFPPRLRSPSIRRPHYNVSVSFYMKMNEQSTIFTLFWIKGCCERTSLCQCFT